MGGCRIYFIKFVVLVTKLEILRQGYDNYLVTIFIIVLLLVIHNVSRIFTRKFVL